MTETNLQKDTLCMQLCIKMPGTRAKVDTSKLNLDETVDDSMLHVSKDILDSVEYRAIQGHARWMRAFMRAKSLPSPLMKGGIYLVPLGRVELVQARLDEMKVEYAELVNTFIAAYSKPGGLVDDAQKRLGNLFDVNDYPLSSELHRAFGIDMQYISMDIPGKLRAVSQAFFEAQKKRSAERWASLEANVVQLIRAEFKTVVDGMVNALGVKEDGKKKALRGKTVERLSEFLKEAPFRNVTDDAELNRLVDASTKLLDGFDVDIVRSDDNLRSKVLESFEIVKGRLDSLVTEAPDRLIEFEEAVS